MEAMLEPLSAEDPPEIGGYRLLGRVGEGGMGVVYAAESGAMTIAVKVIRAEYAADPEFRARFAREVTLLARVSGVSAVPVIAADTSANRPWLATPYITGPTLHDHVKAHGPLRGGALRALAVSVAEALAAMHRVGVVHRDLKPANVILSTDGPRVIDFGIARAMDATSITRTHQLVGSPGWVSPEQYRQGEVSAAGDVFNWGALVAFAATSRPPFGLGSPDVVGYRVVHEAPDLKGVPESLLPLVTRSLSKDPKTRPQSAELVGYITGTSAGDPTQVTTRVVERDWVGIAAQLSTPSIPRIRDSRRRPAVALMGAAAAVLSVLVIVGVAAAASTSGNNPPSSTAVAPTSGTSGPATDPPLYQSSPAASDSASSSPATADIPSPSDTPSATATHAATVIADWGEGDTWGMYEGIMCGRASFGLRLTDAQGQSLFGDGDVIEGKLQHYTSGGRARCRFLVPMTLPDSPTYDIALCMEGAWSSTQCKGGTWSKKQMIKARWRVHAGWVEQYGGS